MILVNLTTILVKYSIALTRKVVKMFSTAETKPRREYPCGALLATGSVSRVLSSTVIYLGASLPVRSSHLLGDGRASLVSSAVLLRIEFTAVGTLEPPGALLPHLSTLTAPLHAPCKTSFCGGPGFSRARTCLTQRYISVALFLKSPSAGVTRYPCPVEPGLSS